MNSSGAAAWNKPEQLYDKETGIDNAYATLERNRWILDGSFTLIPDDPAKLPGQIGFVGNALSGDDGMFSPAVYVEETFSNVTILQACSISFPTADYDGFPVDFTVEVKQGGTAYFTHEVTGNQDKSISLDGFTVHNPDAIRITVTKLSLPGRRLRIPEIIPGVYEEWNDDIIASFDVVQQGSVSCLSLPYGTCTLRMDNLNRRFEPRSKDGVFQSIEERQGITVSIGVELADGGTEWKQVGVFYQYSGGWRTGDNGLTMQWNLVDIVGLVADRTLIPPSTLPTTLGGWIAAVAAQLGTNFSGLWHVDPDYTNLPVTASGSADVSGKKCGDILRWACMATGTWPRADAETGYLTAEPLWSQGNKMDLDNMTVYPTMKANEDLANLIFKLDNDVEYVVSGNSAASSNSVTVDNPFIHTQAQALTAARMILSCYGGNKLEATGRGDPSSEIGDVDTVWLNETSATTGRRIYQTFTIQNGVLQDCQSILLQADGSFMFQSSQLITQSGTWKAPAGVSQLRVIIGQAGQGGMKGGDGTLERGNRPKMNGDTGVISDSRTYSASYGPDGEDGIGGKIWFGTIDINPEQAFVVNIGKGGAPSRTYGIPGTMGGETTFGSYSSANGQVYPNGFTDVASGDSYGRTGVQSPANGSGDGAKGGAGGTPGVGSWHKASLTIEGSGEKIYYSYWRVDVPPGEGQVPNPGGDGFVAIYWDK